MPEAYLALVLHWHHPWVLHHEVWPHGEATLYESMAHAYIPQLRCLEQLARDGYRHLLTISTSPVLLVQLTHPDTRIGFMHYLEDRQYAIREYRQTGKGDVRIAELLNFWASYYDRVRAWWEQHDGDLPGVLRRLHEKEIIDWVTAPLTHPFLPHLGWDAWVRWHLKTGIGIFQKISGCRPTGLWLPEMAYRPSGDWSPPVDTPYCPSGTRPGLNQWLDDENTGWIVLELPDIAVRQRKRQLIHPSEAVSSRVTFADPPATIPSDRPFPYMAYYLAQTRGTVVYFRDPVTARLVWSRHEGYPGSPEYLEFHKRMEDTGLQLWSVTGVDVDLAHKRFYVPEAASHRARDHAEDFKNRLNSLADSLKTRREVLPSKDIPPIIVAPYDGELFGHWWFEGTEWLDALLRRMAGDERVSLTTLVKYHQTYPPHIETDPPFGTWGEGGDDRVWVNQQTTWIWEHLYRLEVEIMRRFLNAGPPPFDIHYILSEMALLHASDWPFLISTQQAREYANKRVRDLIDSLNTFLSAWDTEVRPELSFLLSRRILHPLLTERDIIFNSALLITVWDRVRFQKFFR